MVTVKHFLRRLRELALTRSFFLGVTVALLGIYMVFYVAGEDITKWAAGFTHGLMCGAGLAAFAFIMYTNKMLKSLYGLSFGNDDDDWWKKGEKPPWDSD